MVFQPLPKHLTTPWFFGGTFLFHCHSETWSGTSPQAPRVNRVWLTVPSHRPDHLGYMLMCSTGRERSEIQGLCGRRPNRPCTGKAQTDIWLSSISGKKPCITQRDGMERTRIVACNRAECGFGTTEGTNPKTFQVGGGVSICHCVTNRECSIIDPVTHDPVWPVPFEIFQMSSHRNFTLLDILCVSRRAHKLLSNDWKRYERSPLPLTFRTYALTQAHYRDQTRICD